MSIKVESPSLSLSLSLLPRSFCLSFAWTGACFVVDVVVVFYQCQVVRLGFCLKSLSLSISVEPLSLSLLRIDGVCFVVVVY